jgi:glyoxylase-like metal-dependent hydrolase (beta-lactamase superfamily II)
MNKTLFLVLLLVSASARPLFADTTMFEFEFEEIAEGVWVGVRPDSPRFPVMGNATFVISDAGVVVFDGGGAPAMAEQVIDKIRSLTSAPVTHVVTSHWHGDHNFGVYRFGEEYPGVKFIAHRFTRDLMHSSRIAYIDGSAAFIDNNLEAIRQIVATGKDDEGKPISEATRRTYTSIIKDAVVIDAEYKRSRVTPPNVVIDGDYTIQSGDRSIEILFAGHGNTAGDLFLWLPEERIVAAGDNVVLPSPYAFNMPPRPWAATLKKLKALDYAILVTRRTSTC